METFDTNVLVRLIVLDDIDQRQRAELAWRNAVANSGVFIPQAKRRDNAKRCRFGHLTNVLLEHQASKKCPE